MHNFRYSLVLTLAPLTRYSSITRFKIMDAEIDSGKTHSNKEAAFKRYFLNADVELCTQ